MIQASDEIRRLRLDNQTMKGKLEVYEGMMRLFHASPYPDGRGMSPDPLFELEEYVRVARKVAETDTERVVNKNVRVDDLHMKDTILYPGD